MAPPEAEEGAERTMSTIQTQQTELMSDRTLRRVVLSAVLAAVLLPPFVGGTVLMIVGFWPFPEFYLIFTSYTGVYVALTLAAALWFAERASRAIIAFGHAEPETAKTATQRALHRFPWMMAVALTLYCAGGVLSANLSLEHMRLVPPYDLRGHLINQFGVLIVVLITILPVYYYVIDRVGRYLAPRGVVVAGAPLWGKIALLGLATPVLIDTLLIAYYYLHFGVAEISLILVWGILIALAAASTALVWTSIRQGLRPLRDVLAVSLRAGEPAPYRDLHPQSLDEFGVLTERVATLLAREHQLHDSLEQRVEKRTRELAEEKARAESYLHIANTMIIALGPAGEIRTINRKGCEVLGWPETELVGRNWFETCVPERQRAEVRDVFARIRAGRLATVESYENEVVTADGRERLILWHNSFLRGPDGAIEGCLSSGEDVTESRAAENALNVSEQRFQVSQTFANIGTWDWNIVTGGLYWSERIGPLFGYGDRPIATTYENFLAAIHPDDRRMVTDAVNACVEKVAEYNIEHRIVRADGVVRWLSEKGGVLRDGRGRPIRMLGVVQDITERKAAEDHMRHAQKLESLGNLAGGVAHSLNNLLVPILALSKMTADGLPKNSPGRAALDKVVEASGRAKDLVARVLAFSRREAPHKAPVDLGSVVEDALRLARSSLPSAITLESALPDRPVAVLADAPQIEAVILNLINNAVAAINGADGGGGGDQAGGRIAVRLAVCDLDTQKARQMGKPKGGPCATLTVADNGVGMSAQTKARIFDPFFTTKKVGEGTGLGLSMTHGIVTEHGGMIEVESEPGRGASFHIHLPILNAAADEARTQQQTA